MYPTIIQLEDWEIEYHRSALNSEDHCYYYMSYDSRSDLNTSAEKQIIMNFKISQKELRENPKRARYKEQALKEVASWVTNTIQKNPFLTDYLWIPAPSSKARDDEEYDNRLQQVLAIIKETVIPFKWYDALYVKQKVDASHHSNKRNVEGKRKNLELDRRFLQDLPHNKVVLFDDVLTTGATFKASQSKIKEANRALQVMGIFIAKAVRAFQ